MATGFTFGSKAGTPSFGQAGFGVGAQPTGSITFGTPVSSNPTPFGATAPAPTGFGSAGFGMPSFGTPTTTTQPTGLTFGTALTSTPGFSFGAAPALSAPNTGLTFGTPAGSAPSANTSFGFGTSAPATTGLFGTPASSTFSGFSLGASTAPSTGLTFGTPATTTTPSLGFGSVNPSTGLGLGQQPQATTASGLFTGSTFPFGTPTVAPAPSLNLSFGAATTSAAPTFNLGTPATSASTGLNFGLGTSASTGLNFGLGTSASTGLNFGLGTTAQSGGTSFGLGGTTALSFSKPPPTATTAQTSFGLGGLVQSTPKSGTPAIGKSEIPPREQALPNELLQTVESFKNVVKNQKSFSTEVARYSIKEFKKVAVKIDQMGSTLNDLEKQLQHTKALSDKLKLDTAKGLQHIEMAQRTLDTPPGLQYDNVMPMVYFRELVDGFEREIQNLKIQIENTHKYMRNFGQPVPLNSQDLAVGMKRLHDTFVALAGRLQTVHAQVENQKEQYLNFRKYMMNDETNVFELPQEPNEVHNIGLKSITYKLPAIPTGPSPFSSLSHPNVVQAAVQNQTPTTTSNAPVTTQILPQQTTTPSTLCNTSSLNPYFGQPTLQFNSPTNTGFQLQKPPSGNKRGKQITY